jgi:hypothetical protein
MLIYSRVDQCGNVFNSSHLEQLTPLMVIHDGNIANPGQDEQLTSLMTGHRGNVFMLLQLHMTVLTLGHTGNDFRLGQYTHDTDITFVQRGIVFKFIQLLQLTSSILYIFGSVFSNE